MFNKAPKALKKLENDMASADSYLQWRDAAKAHDELTGASRWKLREQSALYDHDQIRRRLDALRLHRKNRDEHGLLFTLNEGIHGNMGGMGKAELFHRSKYGTKRLIEDYVDEIVETLENIAEQDVTKISLEEKLDFFHRASHCYGRTALMLSGGGALGYFHIGVVKALLENDLLPNVISGSSAGSLIAAVVGTHTDEELLELNHHDALLKEARQEAKWLNKFLFGKHGQIDVHDLEAMVERMIPDLTFQEAFELTGRSINISVAPADLHQTSRLLNAIASPNVYIRRAVVASCAVPGVYPSVMLEAKNRHGERQPYLPSRRWVDGSVSDDLPAKRLSRLYGVNHYIASLINPIVLLSKDGEGDHTRIPLVLRELMHKGATSLARVGGNISQHYTKNWPRINIMVNMFNSILSQQYSADINIYADFRNFELRKILSHLSEDELMELERQGELATWRQLERIRISGRISITLDKILAQYGEEELRHVSRREN